MAAAVPEGTAFIRGLLRSESLRRPRFMALGSFDGLHAGHRALLMRLKQDAESVGGSASVISFYPHPTIVLGRVSERPPLLTLRQRISILTSLGIDALIALRFTRALSQLSAAEFVSQILVQGLDAARIYVGKDAMLGKGREAGVAELAPLLSRFGRELVVVPHVEADGAKIGSRMIRDRIAAGAVEEVEAILGMPVTLEGRVVRGEGRGKSISIPTANMVTRQLVPAVGVYCAVATVGDARFPAVVNIGYRPTFNGTRLSIEAHLPTWRGPDFYGQYIMLELYRKIRDEKRFENAEALVSQIKRDIEEATRMLLDRRERVRV